MGKNDFGINQGTSCLILVAMTCTTGAYRLICSIISLTLSSSCKINSKTINSSAVHINLPLLFHCILAASCTSSSLWCSLHEIMKPFQLIPHLNNLHLNTATGQVNSPSFLTWALPTRHNTTCSV